jgi:ribosomal protein L2
VIAITNSGVFVSACKAHEKTGGMLQDSHGASVAIVTATALQLIVRLSCGCLLIVKKGS